MADTKLTQVNRSSGAHTDLTKGKSVNNPPPPKRGDTGTQGKVALEKVNTTESPGPVRTTSTQSTATAPGTSTKKSVLEGPTTGTAKPPGKPRSEQQIKTLLEGITNKGSQTLSEEPNRSKNTHQTGLWDAPEVAIETYFAELTNEEAKFLVEILKAHHETGSPHGDRYEMAHFRHDCIETTLVHALSKLSDSTPLYEDDREKIGAALLAAYNIGYNVAPRGESEIGTETGTKEGKTSLYSRSQEHHPARNLFTFIKSLDSNDAPRRERSVSTPPPIGRGHTIVSSSGQDAKASVTPSVPTQSGSISKSYTNATHQRQATLNAANDAKPSLGPQALNYEYQDSEYPCLVADASSWLVGKSSKLKPNQMRESQLGKINLTLSILSGYINRTSAFTYANDEMIAMQPQNSFGSMRPSVTDAADYIRVSLGITPKNYGTEVIPKAFESFNKGLERPSAKAAFETILNYPPESDNSKLLDSITSDNSIRLAISESITQKQSPAEVLSTLDLIITSLTNDADNKMEKLDKEIKKLSAPQQQLAQTLLASALSGDRFSTDLLTNTVTGNTNLTDILVKRTNRSVVLDAIADGVPISTATKILKTINESIKNNKIDDLNKLTKQLEPTGKSLAKSLTGIVLKEIFKLDSRSGSPGELALDTKQIQNKVKHSKLKNEKGKNQELSDLLGSAQASLGRKKADKVNLDNLVKERVAVMTTALAGPAQLATTHQGTATKELQEALVGIKSAKSDPGKLSTWANRFDARLTAYVDSHVQTPAKQRSQFIRQLQDTHDRIDTKGATASTSSTKSEDSKSSPGSKEADKSSNKSDATAPPALQELCDDIDRNLTEIVSGHPKLEQIQQSIHERYGSNSDYSTVASKTENLLRLNRVAQHLLSLEDATGTITPPPPIPNSAAPDRKISLDGQKTVENGITKVGIALHSGQQALSTGFSALKTVLENRLQPPNITRDNNVYFEITPPMLRTLTSSKGSGNKKKLVTLSDLSPLTPAREKKPPNPVIDRLTSGKIDTPILFVDVTSASPEKIKDLVNAFESASGDHPQALLLSASNNKLGIGADLTGFGELRVMAKTETAPDKSSSKGDHLTKGELERIVSQVANANSDSTTLSIWVDVLSQFEGRRVLRDILEDS